MRKLMLASVMIFGLTMPVMANDFEDALRDVKAMNCMQAFYFAKGNYEVARGLAMVMVLDWQEINGGEADGDLGSRTGDICLSHPSYTVHQAVVAAGK